MLLANCGIMACQATNLALGVMLALYMRYTTVKTVYNSVSIDMFAYVVRLVTPIVIVSVA